MDPYRHFYGPPPPSRMAMPGHLPPPDPLPRQQSPAGPQSPQPLSRHQSPVERPTPNHAPQQQPPAGPPPPHASSLDQAPFNRLPPNPWLSHIHTDYSHLYYTGESVYQSEGPPYPTTPEPHTETVAAHLDEFSQTTDADFFDDGSQIGLHHPTVDFFGPSDQQDHTIGIEVHPPAASAAQGQIPSSDETNVHTEHGLYSQLPAPAYDPGERPSNAAPTARMQASEEDPLEAHDLVSTTVPTGANDRGSLKLDTIGEGKCDFVSKHGNRCNRPAPRIKAKNGTREECCRCVSKHLPQWKRANALLPDIPLKIMTLDQAKQQIFPHHKRFDEELLNADPTLLTEQNQQDKWQARFLQATLDPYSGANQKLKEQQICFNGCVQCDEDGHFSDNQVNARMALLYHIAHNTHVGGERLYAVYGDNSGYPREHPRLTFLQRLEMIERLLRDNKRIVMDVIQGRGVLAFVATPDAYHRRKATNNTNNEFKKRDRPEEDDNDQYEGASSPPLKKKAKNPKQPATRATKGGKGKEKMQEMPVPVGQNHSGADQEVKTELEQLVPDGPGLGSREPGGASWPVDEDAKQHPSGTEQSDLVHGDDWLWTLPETWVGYDAGLNIGGYGDVEDFPPSSK